MGSGNLLNLIAFHKTNRNERGWRIPGMVEKTNVLDCRHPFFHCDAYQFIETLFTQWRMCPQRHLEIQLLRTLQHMHKRTEQKRHW